jgi:hypothetical protein
MTDQDIKSVAEGLSELEREWITGWQGVAGAAFNAIAEHLYEIGLLNGAADWTLNADGCQLRTYLQEQSNG